MDKNHRRRRGGLIPIAGAVALLALPSLAPAQLETQLADAFGNAIVGVAGTEAQGTYSFDYLGTTITIDVLGVVFCSPQDPWAPPDPTPVPPQTAYGCVNLQQTAATVAQDHTTARITLTLDVVFVDLATQRGMTVLCGEFGSGTVTGDGYLLSSGVVVVDLTLLGNGCVQAALVPGSVVLDLGPVTASLQDDCLDNAWDLVADTVMPDLEAAIQGGLENLIASRMQAFNDELCTLTPTQETTWGRVKGLYGGTAR